MAHTDAQGIPKPLPSICTTPALTSQKSCSKQNRADQLPLACLLHAAQGVECQTAARHLRTSGSEELSDRLDLQAPARARDNNQWNQQGVWECQRYSQGAKEGAEREGVRVRERGEEGRWVSICVCPYNLPMTFKSSLLHYLQRHLCPTIDLTQNLRQPFGLQRLIDTQPLCRPTIATPVRATYSPLHFGRQLCGFMEGCLREAALINWVDVRRQA